MSTEQLVSKYLNPLLFKISSINEKSVLMGDFNIDLFKLNKNHTENYYNSLLSDVFFLFVLQSTRVTGTSNTLIDNIFFNFFEHMTYSGNFTIKRSDHLV